MIYDDQPQMVEATDVGVASIGTDSRKRRHHALATALAAIDRETLIEKTLSGAAARGYGRIGREGVEAVLVAAGVIPPLHGEVR